MNNKLITILHTIITISIILFILLAIYKLYIDFNIFIFLSIFILFIFYAYIHKSIVKYKNKLKPKQTLINSNNFNKTKLLELINYKDDSEQLLIPLNLFETNEIVIDSTEQIQHKARIIINTLRKFKLDATFIKFSANATLNTLLFEAKDYIDENGRTYTFDSTKIENIIENIKLNLGTNSVSFIPIVEGESLFAFEIKSTKENKIRFGNVLNELKNNKFELNYVVGQQTDGKWLTTNIVNHPHTLIIGATNSGKSTFANSMLSQLLATKTPEQLQLWISDNKVVEFIAYKDLPHTKFFAKDYSETLTMLNSLIDIEEHRSSVLFKNIRAKNIISYNRKVDQSNQLPFIVVLIDEFPTLVETDNKTRGKPFMSALNILLSKARAAGIYIHILSQNAKASTIDTTLRGNLQCRIVLSVADANDSQTAGVKGADLLNGFGDLIYKLNQFQERCQSPYISDEEIDKLTDYIKEHYV